MSRNKSKIHGQRQEVPRRRVLRAIGGLSLVSVAGCVENGDSSFGTDASTEEGELIGRSPGDLLLDVNDLPTGWGSTDPDIQGNTADVSFLNSGDDAVLRIEVTVHESIEDAEQAYEEEVDTVSGTYSYDEVSIGHEAISYEHPSEAGIVHLRDSEVTAEVLYDEDFGFDNVGNAEDFASQLVEGFED